jgi:hypothetical protein
VHASAVEDFSSFFDASDTAALVDYLKDIEGSKQPAAGIKEGFESTLLTIKANEAIRERKRIELKDEWFQIS